MWGPDSSCAWMNFSEKLMRFIIVWYSLRRTKCSCQNLIIGEKNILYKPEIIHANIVFYPGSYGFLQKKNTLGFSQIKSICKAICVIFDTAKTKGKTACNVCVWRWNLKPATKVTCSALLSTVGGYSCKSTLWISKLLLWHTCCLCSNCDWGIRPGAKGLCCE